MEEQNKRDLSEDVEAHLRHKPGLVDEDDAPSDEQGHRNLTEDDDDVEAHIRHKPGLVDEDDAPSDEHGHRF